MSPEGELHSPPLGFSSVTEDVSRGDLDRSQEPGRRSRALSSRNTRTPEVNISR